MDNLFRRTGIGVLEVRIQLAERSGTSATKVLSPVVEASRRGQPKTT